MDQYAVIGHPVAHSLSPRIHARFAEQTGEPLVYGRIDPGPGGFAAAAGVFFEQGGAGLNVTLPFKAEAYRFATTCADSANAAGVVNTLMQTENGVCGHNTDGIGLVRDLTGNLGLSVAGLRVLLLGAGGAARGVLGPLLGEAPAMVFIGNRTADRAKTLAADFAGTSMVTGGGWAEVPDDEPFDLIVNASAASLGDELPPLSPDCLRDGGVVYDMMYGSAAHAFLSWGSAAGAGRVSDGLGMLVEQAGESFRIWRGVQPDTAAVLAELRARGAAASD